MLEHVDLCERCARQLMPLLEAPQVFEVEMAYVAGVVAQCKRCKRHAPAILAAQRRFDLERAANHRWHVATVAPSPMPAETMAPVRDWMWIESV